MTGYDIIGDVHGYADRLTNLLSILRYEENEDGGWTRPDGRTAIFVGDLIDRGPQQLETLRIVRSMCDAGIAEVVMGNHEYNAIAYATVDPDRFDYCRPHSEKNEHQHEAFLKEVDFGSPLHRSIIEWFMEMPLWLELDGIRVVHACWSERVMSELRAALTKDDGDWKLTPAGVLDTSRRGTKPYNALEVLLKGPEVGMNGYYYYDKDGHRRDEARIRWWEPKAKTLDELAIIPSGCDLRKPNGNKATALPADDVEEDVPNYTDRVPVFVGHYWESGPRVKLGDFAVCVDYSAGNGGPLVAYRWDEGDTTIDDSKFVAG